MSLDAPTLLFATAVVAAFSGTLIVFTRGFEGETKTVGAWGASMLIGAFGLVMVGLAQKVAFFSQGVGTTIFLVATVVAWLGARMFAGRRPGFLIAGAWAGIWVVSLPLQSNSNFWLGMACLIGAAFNFASAYELWRARAEYLPSRRTAIAVLMIHVAVYAARGGAAFLGDLGPEWNEPVKLAMVFEALLHTMAMAFLIMAMLKERTDLRSSEQLRALALSDGLTGVGNRRHFDERLSSEARRARRSGLPLALLLIDVDHFKSFNDGFGHQEGDVCLKTVAQAIARMVQRQGDLTARYGGEEFAVLMTDTNISSAKNRAEMIRAAVEALAMDHPSSGVVTVSIGVSVQMPQRLEAIDGLVRSADRALYEAKAAGRNCVKVAAPVLAADAIAA